MTSEKSRAAALDAIVADIVYRSNLTLSYSSLTPSRPGQEAVIERLKAHRAQQYDMAARADAMKILAALENAGLTLISRDDFHGRMLDALFLEPPLDMPEEDVHRMIDYAMDGPPQFCITTFDDPYVGDGHTDTEGAPT